MLKQATEETYAKYNQVYALTGLARYEIETLYTIYENWLTVGRINRRKKSKNKTPSDKIILKYADKLGLSQDKTKKILHTTSTTTTTKEYLRSARKTLAKAKYSEIILHSRTKIPQTVEKLRPYIVL